MKNEKEKGKKNKKRVKTGKDVIGGEIGWRLKGYFVQSRSFFMLAIKNRSNVFKTELVIESKKLLVHGSSIGLVVDHNQISDIVNI